MIAPALGPVLGGWLTDEVSWRWIFYLNLPIGILGFIFTLLFVPNHKSDNPGRLDWIGFLLAGAGLASLLVGLERIPTHGWSEALMLTLVLSGLTMLVAFVIVELRISEPMLDLRLLKDRNFAAGNVMVFISTGALMGVLFLAPLLLQQVIGLTATESGFVTLAQVVGMMLCMPLAPKLYPLLGARVMMAIGFAVLATGIFGFSMLEMESNLWWFRGLLLVIGAGMAMIMVPSQTATMETITFDDTANASSLMSTFRQVASAAGVAIISTVLTAQINAQLDKIDQVNAAPDAVLAAVFAGYDRTFVISGCVALIGTVAVMLFRKDSGKSQIRKADVVAQAEVVVTP